MRVLRVYHGGRNCAHRERERALRASGVQLTLIVPSEWAESGAETVLSPEHFPIVELPVERPGDVNRHRYTDIRQLQEVLGHVSPDVLDVHEEPVGLVTRQWLSAAPSDLPVVMYTAQNVDKRYPPPFAQYERRAHRRAAAMYPCSCQAAAVARGKGFAGLLDVIPLGVDPSLYRPGDQSLEDDELVFGLFGRLVPEKGVLDAVRVLARVNEVRPARLVVVGSGPEEQTVMSLAEALGVTKRLELISWRPAEELAAIYRAAHVVLVPSVPTYTWTEQFGRVIVEAHASGAVVAAYATGSISEVGGEPTVLSPRMDATSLANTVVELISNAEEYERRRAAGVALAAERTWERVAERQAELYRRVAAGDIDRVPLPRSPRLRRVAARAEFGASAPTRAGLRPFALPILRRGGYLPAALGALVDAGAELQAGLRAS